MYERSGPVVALVRGTILKAAVAAMLASVAPAAVFAQDAAQTPAPAVVPTNKEPVDPKTPSPEVVARVKKATVRVLVEFKDGKQASGSGFVEKNSRKVVTNAHVVGLKDPKDSPWKIINLIVNSGEGESP